MWFSHLSTPLGPRVRTQYNFILDVIGEGESTTLSRYSSLFTLKLLDVDVVSDLMKMSQVDPDIVDVVRTSTDTKRRAVLASYYEMY